MKKTYEERRDRFAACRDREDSLSRRLGWARAATFVAGFLIYLGFDLYEGLPSRVSGVGLVLALGLFTVLVIWHRRVRVRRSRWTSLVTINETALARLARDWKALPQSPFEDPPAGHPYAHDLDICGESSLFRLMTTVTLPPGAETLQQWLLAPAEPTEIRRRQEAVEELSRAMDLRQGWEAEGRSVESPSQESMRRFLQWAEGEGWVSGHPWLLLGARILPILTLGLFILYWWGSAAVPWWLVSMGVSFVFGTQFRNNIHPLMEEASGGQERFGRYASVLALLLRADVRAPALKNLKDAVGRGPVDAGRELRRLARRVGWSDVRFSPMAHALLQGAFVWDVHVLAGLENWKSRSGSHIRAWLGALGDFEALSALAALKADHPEWCFPVVSTGSVPGLLGSELGHPLLPQSACVRNDISIGPPGTFLFVTGSNMSGKSTTLRAVGINAVLAQAGGPVCADEMELTPVSVQTAMRTTDSLSEGVSQYMAELNRIRQVVDRAREDPVRTILFLLDEPLQGTNEAERRVAVQTILGHLLKAGAIGAVATHDLQLDGTDRLKAAARPVHLAGTVREGDTGPLLTFDYEVRPGRATSTNALALLRAVGLGTVGEGDGDPGELGTPIIHP